MYKTINVWIGTHAVDALAFDNIIPIDAVFTCDYGDDVNSIGKQKFVISLEKQINLKYSWNNFHLNYLFSGELGTRIIEYLSTLEGFVNLICYSSSGSLEMILEKQKFRAKINYCALGIREKMFFDDKFLLHYRLKSLNEKTLPSVIKTSGELNYSSLQKRLESDQFVMKLPISSAGGKIFLVTNQTSLDEIQVDHYSHTVLFQKYQKGISINLQGVISNSNMSFFPPSVQIIGPAECSYGKFDWCGNDFFAVTQIPKLLLDEAKHLAFRIAIDMKSQGYKGIFGLDMLIDVENELVYLLEINPRFQGSTSLLTQLEVINGLDAHILNRHISALSSDEIYNRDYLASSFLCNASQLILHNKSPKPVKVGGELLAGIYEFDHCTSTINFIRKGFTLYDCKNDKEFVISYGVPIRGWTIAPGAPILWLQGLFPIISDPWECSLNKNISFICSDIYKRLDLRPI